MKNRETIHSLYEWSRQELSDILGFYMQHAYDPNGGFYGSVTRELAPVKDADRSLILNARIMWTFASAYRIMQDERYLDMASHAKDYILKHFIDREHGGAYWMLDHAGKPVDESKYPYGIAFVIYAGAEMMRACGDREALQMARDMYEVLEKHTLDRKNGGYFETYDRDWKRRSDSFNIKDPSLGSKALNTHLHMIESYTILMLADKDPQLKETVGDLINIMATKLLDQQYYHYKPYMTDDWQATDTLFSFGHDIEGAWLLTEAAEAYGDEDLLEQCRPISVRIADACADGINPETGGLYAEANEKGLVDCQMSWWVQAEAVIGFFNAYQITRDDKYLDLTLNVAEYIQNYVSDREGGKFREWLSRGDQDKHGPSNEYRVNSWKGPYHNGRMCLELIERIKRLMHEEDADTVS